MTLRTVTIWTAGVELLLTMFIGVGLLAWMAFDSIMSLNFIRLLATLTLGLFSVSIWWIFSSFPLIISFVIAIALRPIRTSNLVLLLSTIAYGIWYVCWYVFVFIQFSQNESLFGIGLMSVGILALLVMIPAWFIALALDVFHTDSMYSVVYSSPNEIQPILTEP